MFGIQLKVNFFYVTILNYLEQIEIWNKSLIFETEWKVEFNIFK